MVDIDWGSLLGDAASAAANAFTSSKTGQTSTSSSVKKYDTMDAKQKALYDTLLAKTGAGLTGKVPSLPDMYVPTTDSEQNYLDWINSGYGNRLLSGTPTYTFDPASVESYYTDYIKNPAMKEYNEITLPGIKAAYAGPGYYGSARMNAQTRAGENLVSDLAQQRAQLYYDELRSSREAQESAANRAMEASGQLYQAGELERNIASEEVTDALTRYLSGEKVNGQQAWYYNPNVSMAMSLLGISPYTYATTTKTEGSSAGEDALYAGANSAIQALLKNFS